MKNFNKLALRPALARHRDRKSWLSEGKNWVMSNAITLV